LLSKNRRAKRDAVWQNANPFPTGSIAVTQKAGPRWATPLPYAPDYRATTLEENFKYTGLVSLLGKKKNHERVVHARRCLVVGIVDTGLHVWRSTSCYWFVCVRVMGMYFCTHMYVHAARYLGRKNNEEQNI
jgi:hypothetical protein